MALAQSPRGKLQPAEASRDGPAKKLGRQKLRKNSIEWNLPPSSLFFTLHQELLACPIKAACACWMPVVMAGSNKRFGSGRDQS